MRFRFLGTLALCATLLCGPQSLANADKKQSESAKVSDIGTGALPSISSNGKISHLAFQNQGAIYYSSSSDLGTTWSAPAKVSGEGKSCSFASIAAGNDGSVNIVWQDKSGQAEEEIFYSRSSDGGKSWSNPINISNTTTGSSEPKVAVGPDNAVHVVWIDTLSGAKSPDVYYLASTDAGKTWSERADLSNTPGICSNPAIAVSPKGTVHIAWLDNTPGEPHPDIFYVYNDGKGFGKWQNLSHSPHLSAHPSIACGTSNKVYVVWSDNSRRENAADIWCAIGHDGHFREPVNISYTRGVSSQAAVGADQTGRSAIVWCDTTRDSKVPDIWARTGYEGGFSNVLQIFDSAARSIHPAVTLVEKTAYAVWEEQSNGTSTIKGIPIEVSTAVGPAQGVNQEQYGHSR